MERNVSLPRNRNSRRRHQRSAVLSGLSAGLILAITALPGHAETNKAQYMMLENCGGYDISKVKLDVRVYKHTGWVHTGAGLSDGEWKLQIGDVICFDLNHRPAGDWGVDGNEFRIRTQIEFGDSKKCDSTSGKIRDGDLRVFRMKGTTHNNNGCRSRGYFDTSADGQKRANELCSGS